MSKIEYKQFIYLEPNLKKPIVVYKTVEGLDTFLGVQCSEKFEHALNGLGAFYKREFLLTYSEAQLADCIAYCERRDQRKEQTKKEFAALFKGQRILI